MIEEEMTSNQKITVVAYYSRLLVSTTRAQKNSTSETFTFGTSNPPAISES